MYKIVEKYIKDINNKNDELDATCLLEENWLDSKLTLRGQIFQLLTFVYAHAGWSNEFITCYAVYCNFCILHGLYDTPEQAPLWDEFFEKNHISLKQQTYLEHIRYGIWDQDISRFLAAIDEAPDDFDLPHLYVYLLSFLRICAKINEACESKEAKQAIPSLVKQMNAAKNNIHSELVELTEPLVLDIGEKPSNKISKNLLLPRILIADPAADSLSSVVRTWSAWNNLSSVKISDFDSLLSAWKRIKRSKTERPTFLLFARTLFRQIQEGSHYTNFDLYTKEDTTLRDASSGALQREYLNLPIRVSGELYLQIMKLS